MNQLNELRPINTIVPYELARGDQQEVPECEICLDTEKKVNCIGSDRIVCHRALPSERNPENIIYHYFHKTCLGEWLITPNSENKCPNCETVLSNESIAQELALSPMEKGVQMAEKFLSRAARGAFYGAWSWAVVYTLMGHQTDLGDFSDRIIRSVAASSIVYPLVMKGFRANPDLFSKLSLAALPIAGYWHAFFQETESTACDWLRTVFNLIPLLLSRDAMGAMEPELFATSEFLERKIDNWSWKAIPGLALGVAVRMLPKKWWWTG